MPGIIEYDPAEQSRLIRPFGTDDVDFTSDSNNVLADSLIPTGLTSPWGDTGGTRPRVLYADLIIIP